MKELKIKKKELAAAEGLKNELKEKLEELHQVQSTCERNKLKHVEILQDEMVMSIEFFKKMTFSNEVVARKVFNPAVENIWKHFTRFVRILVDLSVSGRI